MPLFAADNFEIKCGLTGVGKDAQGQDSTTSPYIPVVGGNLEGKLQITCRELTKIRGLVLSYRVFRTMTQTDISSGQLQVLCAAQANKTADLRYEHGDGESWLVSTSDGPRAIKVELEDEGSSRCRKIYQVDVVLVGSRHGASMEIPQGTYVYPFQIPLPSSLSPSEDLRVVAGNEIGDKFVFGIRHEICATVIIANGIRDYERKWAVRTQCGVHPTLHNLQQPDTKFQDSPTFYFGACCPWLGKTCPGPLKTESNTFCFQVLNPILALSLDRSISFRLSTMRDITTRPVYVHVVRKMRFGVAPGRQMERVLSAIKLNLETHGHGHDQQQQQQDVEFSVSLEELGLLRRVPPSRASLMNRQSPLNVEDLPLVATGPCTVSSIDYSVSYYVVVRQVYSDDEWQLVKQLGVIPRDEARIPLLIFHTKSDEVPIGAHRMSWLPSASTVHAAPQWRRAPAAAEASTENVNTTATTTHPGDISGSGSGVTAPGLTLADGTENAVTLLGSYVRRNPAPAGAAGRVAGGGDHPNSGSGGGGIVVASTGAYLEPAEGSVVSGVVVEEAASPHQDTWEQAPNPPISMH